jgi:hypothetical protein
MGYLVNFKVVVSIALFLVANPVLKSFSFLDSRKLGRVQLDFLFRSSMNE